MIPNPTFFGLKTPIWVVQEAYNRLFIWEENEAVADGRVSYEEWLLQEEDPLVKDLIEKALEVDLSWGDAECGSDLDVRPSLLLLQEDWLSENGFQNCHNSVIPQMSQIFREYDPLKVKVSWE